MRNKRQLSENIEDYLETILELQEKKTVARSKDIAEKLDIKRGSVTGMLKKLSQKQLINYEPYGYVTLTQAGEKVARKITQRHIFLKDFFHRVLQVDEQTADRTACQMEHAMNKETFAKLKKFLTQAESCLHGDMTKKPELKK